MLPARIVEIPGPAVTPGPAAVALAVAAATPDS